MADKEKSSKKTVDALLTEVASAAGVPKRAPKAAAPASPKPAATVAAEVKSAPAPKTIRIRQIRSGICTPIDHKQALRGLGLRRIRHEVVRPDTPAIRGQILKVRHLVEVVGE